MKQSLSELQTQVEAKSKVFGKFSPYPISCDDLLWLIKQVNAAQQSVRATEWWRCSNPECLCRNGNDHNNCVACGSLRA